MKVCLENRLLHEIGMNQTSVLSVEDPRRVSSVLAPVPPPPTAELVAEKKYHFSESRLLTKWTRNEKEKEMFRFI